MRRQTGMTVEEENEMEYLFIQGRHRRPLSILVKVREEIDSLSFVRVPGLNYAFIPLYRKRVLLMVSFIETEFLSLYFRNAFREVFFSLLGHWFPFPPFISFLQKNLTDSWSQLLIIRTFLNSLADGIWDLGCDWDYNQFYGSYTNGILGS